MENGGISDKFGGLTINDAKDTSLFQVMKAVEAAEATIRQQVEENNRLKEELHRRNQELEVLKLDKPVAQSNFSINRSDEERQGINKIYQPSSSILDPSSTLALNQDGQSQPEESMRPFHMEGYSGVGHSNGYLNTPSGSQPLDNVGFSRLSSPSPTSFSPGRYLKNNQFDSGMNGTTQGLMPMVDSNNNSSLWKQSNSLVQKIKENEEEITQLRKQLTEYSVKEAQIRNEKYVLEKRIAHMRMAFDQQQKDLIDAASKALSYRQDIIEENVRLTYALQDAQHERTIFVSSLLPILSEYSLQPQISDAQSIVSNIKVLFRHLQEKLIITEAKLKESQYQLTPWRSDGNNPNFASQSPDHSSGATRSSNKFGLELVPRSTNSHVNLVNSDDQNAADWESRRQHTLQAGTSGVAMQSSELYNMGRYSPLGNREAGAHDTSSQGALNGDEMMQGAHNRQVKFRDPLSSSDAYGVANEGHHNEREHSRNWDAGTSASNTLDDPASLSPYLQPVPEEPSSSFSEAAEDDPLPAIEGLQISGEAYPGRELQACGYSINGTTSCNFEWVRHMEDGSVQYIDGAKQPIYLVTADDVENYLAIEVQPLDDRKRKGELVKVFANEHRKIVCDPLMQSHIEQTLRTGQSSYKVSLSTGYLDIWEPANLTIKRDGYSIKGSGSSGVTISEKFSPGITVSITYGHDFDFSISNPNGVVHLVRAENYMEDIASLRDLIVLVLRLFIVKALQSGKGKKRRVKLFSK